MKRRMIFPLFNSTVGMLLGAAIGYYLFQPALATLAGALTGLVIGLAIEVFHGKRARLAWWYRRRALIVVLLEIPLAVFVVGPYAFVIAHTQPHHYAICCETPLDYGAVSYEDVQIYTEDGIMLSGWYVPAAEPQGAVVVVLHGSGGDRRGGAWQAAQLIQTGYGVLLYDQRGLGESTGDTVYVGWMAGRDLLAVLDFLAGRPEVRPERIGVVGLSGGAHIALNAAYLEPERFPALWLDGLQAQRIEDFPKAETLGERFATLINATILGMTELHFGRPAPPAFVEMLAGIDQTDIVIVAAGLDGFESRVNQQFAQVIGPSCQVWQLENVGHLGGPAVVPDEYRQRLLAFFDTALVD